MDTVALSAGMLRVVNSAEEILRVVSAEESRAPVLAGGWSRRQVMGHLIDSASNNHQRFVRASLQDSLEFPGYDQNGWAHMQAAEEADWSLLLALWANYNRYLAHIIAHLPPANSWRRITCGIWFITSAKSTPRPRLRGSHGQGSSDRGFLGRWSSSNYFVLDNAIVAAYSVQIDYAQ